MPSATTSSGPDAYFATLSPALSNICTQLRKSYSLSADELFYKIESHQLQRLPADGTPVKPSAGADELDEQLLEDLRLQLQEQLERRRARQAKQHQHASPYASSPSSAGTPLKRKFAGLATTPTPAKTIADMATTLARSSPLNATSYTPRVGSATVLETLNDTLTTSHTGTATKPRLTAFMDMRKYHFRTMRQSLLETSEYLDERIEQFADLTRKQIQSERDAKVADNNGSDGAEVEVDLLANPAAISHGDVVVVGRIVSDSVQHADISRINTSSVFLETSRRMGSGARVPLSFGAFKSRPGTLSSLSIFPGQIVALRGSNPTGTCFMVSGIVHLPDLQPHASPRRQLAQHSTMTRTVLAKGPYTTRDSLSYAPLRQLVDDAIAARADALVLLGPFVDATHPLFQNRKCDDDDDDHGMDNGEDNADLAELLSQGAASFEDVFRLRVAREMRRFESALPHAQILLVPESGLREAIQQHISFPAPPPAVHTTSTESTESKLSLGLGRRTKWLCNPSCVALNASVLGIANIDVLMQLAKVEHFEVLSAGGSALVERSALTRGVRNVLAQRSFYPVFPPARDHQLELGYMGLADMTVLPDILVLPSDLRYFAKVVDSVVAINPGTLTKHKSGGTYAVIDVLPYSAQKGIKNEDEDEDELIAHDVWQRCKVEIRKI
ncbi:DNA polymerase alpha subunit B N-terminal-domain-containing protein [Limtongia smithiae]|uniref:DNA polymerase alpha subunit B N-terminal-domain-containing protein n=1 Tax=Limtongia smithiae TaxID=1125753 RepID=UPI0034CE47D4